MGSDKGGWKGLERLSAPFLAERQRWILWFPVFVGIGSALYFSLSYEPPSWMGAAMLAAGTGLALAAQVRRPQWAAAIWITLVACALGFTAGQYRTHRVAAPVLLSEIGPTGVTGRVLRVEPLANGMRLVLTDVSIYGLPPDRTPHLLRLLVRAKVSPPEIGQPVRLFARVGPPGDPVEPGAFDFRRHLYFQGIGGSGFVLGPPRLLGMPDEAFSLERWRQAIAARVEKRLSGAAAGVTTALLNGQPSSIPEADLVAMREAGLQHLLSISGLHIGLVAGLVFLVLRGGMALWPAFALRHAIKKYAAVGAMAAALFYMLMVGAPVPTQRSVLMTGIMLLAVLADRSPFSMRVVAMAALAVMLVQPESITGPSFQMSFAAVIALIAAYEVVTPWMAARRRDGVTWWGRALTYAGGLTLTSVVAGFITVPFGLHHFQQMQNYGLLANLIAVPVTSFWVMPWGLIVYLLMPLGLEGWAIVAMGWGVEAILWAAHLVSALPGAATMLPHLPMSGLAIVTLSCLWLCLWQGRVRLLGLAGILAGLLTMPLADRPDIRIGGEGKVIAVRLADGGLAVSTRRTGRFDSDAWAQRDGLSGPVRTWPRQGTPDGRLRCRDGGCIYSLNGRRVGLVLDAAAAGGLCAAGLDAVLSRWPLPGCEAPLVIDEAVLTARGAHALHLRRDGIAVVATRAAPGARPWE
ncbi:ComEC/Rec2 family competence protein [Niveispirillum fermenti]|uniref:ComEC/Rec2 family competence protein n=1 Tax=Niveispirillum fermenti TaxID=1233113 RepID=UPI003A83693C